MRKIMMYSENGQLRGKKKGRKEEGDQVLRWYYGGF